MATQGPLGGTGVGASWTNPTNIATTNAVYATESVAGSSSSTNLNTSSMGFSIPVGATINGIQIDIIRHASAISSLNFGTSGVNLTKAGTPVGTNVVDGTNWGTTDATTTFGGPASLFGTTWAPSDINNTGFGVVLIVDNVNAVARTASIDSVLITVTFTPATSTSTSQMFMMF